jgi:hypothetical protein
LQTAVPNYQDVDLSYLYQTKPLVVNFAQMEQQSPYDFMEQFISDMQQTVELQLSSPQIEEFMRFGEFCALIAQTGKP